MCCTTAACSPAFEALTGEAVFGRERIPQGHHFTASPWAYDGKVFCVNEDGVTFVFRAGDEFELLHTNKLADDDMCMATPAIAGDRLLLLRTSARVYCIRQRVRLLFKQSLASDMNFEMALVQMSVTGGDKRRNLARAEELIAEAAAHGSRLVVLPEAMDLGWTHPSSRTAAEPIPDGEPCRRLAESAACHGIFLCAGLTERCGDQVFNSAVILGKAGELLCLHRKINELEIGHPFYAQGDRLNVAATELGTLGLMICADGFAKDHVLGQSTPDRGRAGIASAARWWLGPTVPRSFKARTASKRKRSFTYQSGPWNVLHGAAVGTSTGTQHDDEGRISLEFTIYRVRAAGAKG
jgi:hypothetical protein